MKGYFMLNIQDLHVPVLCDINYIIYIYSVKKKAQKSSFDLVYFDMLISWVKLDIHVYDVLCYPFVFNLHVQIRIIFTTMYNRTWDCYNFIASSLCLQNNHLRFSGCIYTCINLHCLYFIIFVLVQHFIGFFMCEGCVF